MNLSACAYIHDTCAAAFYFLFAHPIFFTHKVYLLY